MTDLRERFIAANLAIEVFIDSDGYPIRVRTDAEVVDAAVAVVAQWLRDEAAELREDQLYTNADAFTRYKPGALDSLADAIDPQETKP